jgi:DNA polymerase-3 subunit gamma/tau
MAAALSQRFGEPLAVDIAMGVVSAETPVQEGQRREQEQLAAARAELESDPNVQAMKDLFGAKLKPESIELINPQSNEERSS